MLKHPWLASLSKPVTITEEDEGEEAEQVAAQVGQMALSSATDDEEVAEWVKDALLRKATGDIGGSSNGAGTPSSGGRPALHAAPLDTVSPLASPVLAE